MIKLRGITDLVTVPTVTFESSSNIRPNGDVNDKRRPFGVNVRQRFQLFFFFFFESRFQLNRNTALSKKKKHRYG